MAGRKRKHPRFEVHYHGEGTQSFDSNTFKVMNDRAKSLGLPADNLLMLCSWMESKKTSEKNKLELIECLIPEQNGGTIPEEVCMRLTYLLKSSEISQIVKIELLKWMVAAHSFMETSGKFQILYETYFGLLKTSELRPYAAHFICLITQEKHVTQRRIKCLYKYFDEHGDVSCLPILRAYYILAPEYFEDELNEAHLIQPDSFGVYPNLIKKVHHAYEPSFANVLLTNVNPNTTIVTDSHAVTIKPSPANCPRVSSFPHLYKQYRALERSNNVSKILKSKLRRLFLTSGLKHDVETKIHDYILAMLHQDFDSQDIIEKHLELFRLQRSIPCISEFTEFLLLKHNSNPDVVEAMCYEPVTCFKKIQSKLQVIKENILGTEDAEIKCRWLNSLSKMFCYWSLQRKNCIPCDQSCNNSDDSDSDSPVSHMLSAELYKFKSELDSLCDILITEDCSLFVLDQVLQHYHMLAIVRQSKPNFDLCYPSPDVFQLSLFSLTPLILETLSELLLRIKQTYESKPESLNKEEFIILQACCNDIKKVFYGEAYENEVAYLAKSEIFKKLNERCSVYKDGFIMFKHPAFLSTSMQFGSIKSVEDIAAGMRKEIFCNQLAKSGCNYFVRLFSKIK